VLVRYEEDYEILSQEKEQLNSQLLNAQTEIESLREEKNKVESVVRLQDEENFAKKIRHFRRNVGFQLFRWRTVDFNFRNRHGTVVRVRRSVP
jgi:hypothetical protein